MLTFTRLISAGVALALVGLILTSPHAVAAPPQSYPLTYSSSLFAGNRTVNLIYSETDTAAIAARRQCAALGLTRPLDNAAFIKVVAKQASFYSSGAPAGSGFATAAFKNTADKAWIARACDGGPISV